MSEWHQLTKAATEAEARAVIGRTARIIESKPRHPMAGIEFTVTDYILNYPSLHTVKLGFPRNAHPKMTIDFPPVSIEQVEILGIEG